MKDDLNRNGIQSLFARSRTRGQNGESPEDYYNNLPSLKKAVLADMAMGIQRSADAEEGIREQRMANAPSVFPSSMFNESLGVPRVVDAGDGERNVFVTPYELIPGINEQPRFIVGEINQDNIARRGEYPSSERYVPTADNYKDDSLSKLKPGQAILINRGTEDYYRDSYSTPAHLIVAKGEDGILYQRQIDSNTYNLFKEAMRSGYPAGAEQLLIDEIASRSQMPRVRQDEVWSVYPTAGLRQLTYYENETVNPGAEEAMNNGVFLPQTLGYVTTERPQSITAISEMIPRKDNILRALLETLLIDKNSNVPNAPENYGQSVLQHEYAHIVDNNGPLGESAYSGSEDYYKTTVADAKANAKYVDNFIPDSTVLEDFGKITLGEVYGTEYGATSIQEDFAEKQLLWIASKKFGRVGTDNNGYAVTFEKLFPNAAKYFETIQRGLR